VYDILTRRNDLEIVFTQLSVLHISMIIAYHRSLGVQFLTLTVGVCTYVSNSKWTIARVV
jgi:hypothetical protein